MNITEDERPPMECRTCHNWRQVKEKIRVSELLAKVINAFEERITNQDFKPTIAEYLKLMQLEQESEQDTPREIKVTWVDPTATSHSEE